MALFHISYCYMNSVGGQDQILFAEDFHQIEQRFPSPVRRYCWGTAVFDIYQAKQFYDAAWGHEAVRAMVRQARRAYCRYGNVPLEDAYDSKALVYLCRVQFPYNALASPEQKNILLKEWLSIRFIPADGEPASTEDLDQFLYARRPIRHWFEERLGGSDNLFLRKILTISRICGIPPHLAQPGTASTALLPTSLQYTALAFFFLNHHLFTELHFNNIQYVTGVFSEVLLHKIIMALRQQAYPSFTMPAAEDQIGCSPEHITLDRSVMAHQFPGYFLNVYQLVALLQRLYWQGKLTIATFACYAPHFFSAILQSWQRFSYKELLQALQGIGNLLTVVGPIPHSLLTGEELRALVEKEVADGSRLRIVSTSQWRFSIEESFKALAATHFNMSTTKAESISPYEFSTTFNR